MIEWLLASRQRRPPVNSFLLTLSSNHDRRVFRFSGLSI